MKSSVKISRGQIENVYKSYTDIDDFLADQANQSSNRIYKVIDASLDPNLTFPSGETRLHAYYEYKETPNSDIGDYDLIGAPFADGGNGGGGGVQSVTGDGVSGTPEDVVLTFPTANEIGAIEDAPSDGKQYARKDANWDEVVIPSSGVQSVTGDDVDNTDPKNPVVNRTEHTGDVTGTKELTIANKAVTNEKLANMTYPGLKGTLLNAGGSVVDIPTNDLITFFGGMDLAQFQNNSPDKFARMSDVGQTNFNIYNQNKANQVVINTTTKSSIIAATTGVKALPSYNEGDSYIGKVFGFFDPLESGRDLDVYFSIGNREHSVQAQSQGILSHFVIDYKIDFPVNREASITGVISVGRSVFSIIDIDTAIITGLDFDIKIELEAGILTVNSSYLHKNYIS